MAKQNIVNFYKKGIIVAEEEDIVSCACGVVNATKSSLASIRKMKLATVYEGEAYCNKCKSVCKEKRGKVLKLKTSKVDLPKENINKKLLTMFSCRWGSKECQYSEDVYKKITHYSVKQSEYAYKVMTKFSDGVPNEKKTGESDYAFVCRIIKYGTNFHKNLMYVKNLKSIDNN